MRSTRERSVHRRFAGHLLHARRSWFVTFLLLSSFHRGRLCGTGKNFLSIENWIACKESIVSNSLLKRVNRRISLLFLIENLWSRRQLIYILVPIRCVKKLIIDIRVPIRTCTQKMGCFFFQLVNNRRVMYRLSRWYRMVSMVNHDGSNRAPTIVEIKMETVWWYYPEDEKITDC